MIDAHFHIWRQADLPWLSGPMQPRIFGPYEPIRRDYPIAEYRADIAGQGVDKAVYVQANWPPAAGFAEAEWVSATAAETGWPHAIVAFCDMTVEDARPELDRLARLPLVRGIRQQFHWHENPQYRFAPRVDLCRDENVRRNIARLADYGWAFDLQLFAAQIPAALDLLSACPGVPFVLQHAGMLEDLSHDGRAAWREAMTAYARLPNAFAKLSGFGTFIHRNEPAHVRWLVRETVAIMGAERCLFGSNFPIEKLWTDYASLLAAHRAAADDLGASARAAIFRATASRIYRI